MQPEFSQKTTCLCVIGGVALIIVTALVMESSTKRRCAPHASEEVIDMSHGPAAGEAAPMPPVPAADLDDGIDVAPQDGPTDDLSD